MPDSVDVSVVIPTRDRPDLLLETLASVFAQTRPPREVIVVDDGGDGRTAAALEPFLDRLILLRSPGRGVQAARNAGISAASGTWIATLDDDDLYRPDFLELVEPALLDGRADLVVTDHRKFTGRPEEGRVMVRTNGELVPPRYWDGIAQPLPGSPWSYVGAFPIERLLRFNTFYPSTMVLRKTLVERVGGFDPAVFGIKAEDLDFTLRALAVARVAIVWRELVLYRVHRGNDSGTLVDQRLGRWRILERAAVVHAPGIPALAAALAADLPPRRRRVFDTAFRHGLFDVVAEVSPRLAADDWTAARRLRRIAARLPRPVSWAVVGMGRRWSRGVAADRAVALKFLPTSP